MSDNLLEFSEGLSSADENLQRCPDFREAVAGRGNGRVGIQDMTGWTLQAFICASASGHGHSLV